MKEFNVLFIALFILVGFLLTPLIFIALDFWSGVRKAKQRGEKITSDGWTRTVAKIGRYYNMLFAFVVVDSMQIAGVWYLDTYYDYHIPIFPWLTMIGACIVAAIEIRSIFEKAEDKVKKQVSDVSSLAENIAKNISSPAEIAQAVVNYMNTNDLKTTQDEGKSNTDQ